MAMNDKWDSFTSLPLKQQTEQQRSYTKAKARELAQQFLDRSYGDDMKELVAQELAKHVVEKRRIKNEKLQDKVQTRELDIFSDGDD